MIHRQVMNHQQSQPAVVGLIEGAGQSQQRCLAQIQTRVTDIETLEQLADDIAVPDLEIQPLQRQRHVTQDHLHRRVQPFPDHCRAQDVVAVDDRLQGLDEVAEPGAIVQRKQPMQHVRIAAAGRQMMVEDTFLQRCQWIDILHIGNTTGHVFNQPVDLRLAHFDQWQEVWGDSRTADADTIGRDLDLLAGACFPGKRFQRRRAEQGAGFGIHPLPTHALDQPYGGQRMPAQLEKVVVTPYSLDAQHLLPQQSQGLLPLTFGCLIGMADADFGRWQGSAVQLAIDGQRKRRQVHERRWHHVSRQRVTRATAQTLGQPVGTGVISDKAHFTRAVLPCEYRHLKHAGQGDQRGLDLAQLNAKTADLHLVVIAPQEFDVAIGHPASQVATLVHPRTGCSTERIVDKTLGGQARLVQVTSCDVCAGEIEFTDRARRNTLAELIKNVNPGVGHRAPDVQRRVVLMHLPGSDQYRGFGRAVGIDQCLSGRQTGRPLAQPITADQHVTGQWVGKAAGVRQFRQRGDQNGEIHSLHFPPLQQGLRVVDRVRRRQQQRAADTQRRPDFPDTGVETDAGEPGTAAAFAKLEPLVVPGDQVIQLAVLDHHAFRSAGGTRGVDHVGQ